MKGKCHGFERSFSKFDITSVIKVGVKGAGVKLGQALEGSVKRIKMGRGHRLKGYMVGVSNF